MISQFLNFWVIQDSETKLRTPITNNKIFFFISIILEYKDNDIMVIHKIKLIR
jgi:hypothetical protein